uniref:Uncharacterized protein n=1 Tax=Opuntia streptacantha TaxID=393608 RepID=A0A7C9DBH6_OPUST
MDNKSGMSLGRSPELQLSRYRQGGVGGKHPCRRGCLYIIFSCFTSSIKTPSYVDFIFMFCISHRFCSVFLQYVMIISANFSDIFLGFQLLLCLLIVTYEIL